MQTTKFMSVIVAALCLAVSPAAAGDKESLSACANAAAYGPLKKGITVAGHDFNCHPITVAKNADIVAAGLQQPSPNSYYKGRLSHALRLRPDDQVDYLIVLQVSGGWCGLEPPIMKINRGGFASVGGGFVERFGVNESDWRALAKKLEGDWEATANVVVRASVTEWAKQFPHCKKAGW